MENIANTKWFPSVFSPVILRFPGQRKRPHWRASSGCHPVIGCFPETWCSPEQRQGPHWSASAAKCQSWGQSAYRGRESGTEAQRWALKHKQKSIRKTLATESRSGKYGPWRKSYNKLGYSGPLTQFHEIHDEKSLEAGKNSVTQGTPARLDWPAASTGPANRHQVTEPSI